MADWLVLGLSGDPVPGDPGGVRSLAARLGSSAGLARSNTERLRGVVSDVSGGPLQARGDYAARYVAEFGELPELLGKLGDAYRGCAEALTRYAGSLEEARARSRVALQRGDDAFVRFTGARRQADALVPVDRVLPWRSGVAGVAGLCAAVSVPQADAVTVGLDENVRTQVRAAVVRAANAAADQATARRLADEAASLREGAALRCAEEIDAVLEGSGIKNKAWWEKAWDTVGAPFRSWDAFVDLCGKVALVAGVVALFISGPIGWALMAAALVAGAVLLADTLHKYANGQAGLLDVGIAVLGVIPGGRGVLSASKLAGAARGFGTALVRGGSKALGQGAFGLRTAVPHGLAIAGGIRSAARNPGLFARAVVCRAFKADPVDVATGDLFIDVIDVALPGSLPLTVRRIHQSSYRVGHAFGRSWNTNLDHRLEVDDAGIGYAGDDGALLLFPHPGDGQTVEPSEGARLQLRSVPDAGGFTVTDPLSGVCEHFAPLAGLAGVTALPLVATTDRAGRRIDYSYDVDGYLTGIEHSGGYRIRVDRGSDGLVSALVLLGRPGAGEADTTLVNYAYDSAGRLVGVVNSSGLPMRYSYDAAGRLVRWEDRNGTWYQYEYDSEGRVVRADGTEAILRARFSYHPGDGRTVFTDSLGQVWSYESNEAGQLTAIIDPTGARTVQTWDRYHRLLSATDPLGRTTEHVYDGVGNRTGTTLPDGALVTTRFNGDNLPVSVRLPDGAVWSADYDPAGLLLSRSTPDASITRYAYDDHGHLTTIVDALDHTTRVICDPAGLPVSITDPLGAATTVVRDGFGRPITVTDPLGAVTRLAWTVEGHLRERIDPDGAVWAWTYDGEDNLRAATDPVGRTTRYAPTPFDQTTRVETPDGAVTQYGYDTERRLTTVINPQGLTWTYTRDPRGLIIAETDFNAATTTYHRDAAGQVTRRTNAVGQTLDYTHDARGNPVSEHAGNPAGNPAGTATAITSFEYDVLGRLVRATNPDVDLRLTRDALGRITSETTNGHTLTNDVDALGRRTTRTTPSAVTSEWSYDSAGRPVTLTSGGHILDFAWDSVGNPVTRRFGATTLTQTFDPLGRLLTQTLTQTLTPAPPARETPAGRHAATPLVAEPRWHREHAYDLAGHLSGLDDGHTGSRAFTVDAVGRVTTVTGPSGPETYAYDRAGNVVDATWPAPDAAAGGDVDPGACGPRDYAGTLVRGAGGYTFTHDRAGRLVRRRHRTLSGKVRVWSYTWDAADRLTAVTTADGSTWRYTYDPLGRRHTKQRLNADGLTVAEQTRFTWDGPTLAEQVHSPSGAVTTWDYQPATFIPVAGQGRDQDRYDRQFHAIITDLVGSPAALVTPDGHLTREPDRSLWGACIGEDHRERSDLACPLRFPGQYHDPETGLHYNLFRYYDPHTARYTSPDPLGLLGGPNPHTYVPNPLESIDPLGLTTYGVDLAATERAFPGLAHTLAEHVRPTRAEAVQLAVRKGAPNGVFADEQLASQVADYAIANNASGIRIWLARSDAQQRFFRGGFGPMGTSLGFVAHPHGLISPAGNQFRIGLQRAKGYPGGFYVYTAFPQ